MQNSPLVTAIVLSLCIVGNACSTEQFPDRVKIGGVTGVLMQAPLESFWRVEGKTRPKFDWRTTGNWKGYEARWEVKDRQLVLTDFTRATINGIPVSLSAAMHEDVQLPWLAAWYSGELFVGIGEPTYETSKTPHIWNAKFPKMMRIKVTKGRVVDVSEKTHSCFPVGNISDLLKNQRSMGPAAPNSRDEQTSDKH